MNIATPAADETLATVHTPSLLTASLPTGNLFIVVQLSNGISLLQLDQNAQIKLDIPLEAVNLNDMVLSPQSTEMAFIMNEMHDGNDIECFVRTMDLQSYEMITLAGPYYYCERPQWSSDGQYIAFMADPDFTNADIFNVSVLNGIVQQLTDKPTRETSPFWMADDQTILFESEEGPEPGKVYLHKIDIQTGQSEIISQIPIYGMNTTDVHREAYFAIASTNNGTGIYRFNPGDQIEELVIETRCDIRHFALSPDTEKVLFTAECSRQVDVFLSDLRGGEVIQITDDQIEEWKPIWITPTMIAYITDGSGEQIILYNLETMESGIFYEPGGSIIDMIWIP